MKKVKALDTYEKNSIKDKELDRIPKAGEIFEVSEERLDILLGNNDYDVPFVEIIKEKPKKINKAILTKEDKNIEKEDI